MKSIISRAYLLSHGRVVRQGTPAQLFRYTEELLSLGLDVPVTAKCALLLKKRGIELETDFTCDDFIAKTLALWKGQGGGNAQ